MLDQRDLPSSLAYSDLDLDVAHAFNDAMAAIDNMGRDTMPLRHSSVDQLVALEAIEERHDKWLTRIVAALRPSRVAQVDLEDTERALYGAERYYDGLGTDPMTELPTRYAFTNILKKELLQLSRNGKKLGVLNLDLNGFKTINSKYGHGTGDEAIKLFAAALKDVTRGGDFICRRQAGGDEFFVMFPGIINEEDPEKFVEDYMRRLFGRVKEMLEDKQYAWNVVSPEGKPIWFDGDIPLYASYGISMASPQDEDILDAAKADKLIEEAEANTEAQKIKTKAYRGT